MAANAFFADNQISDLGGNVVLVDQSFGGSLQQQFHSPVIPRKKGFVKESISGVKRSASTPNVRSLVDGDVSNMSLAEKRRNKLGYHRTSIACSHCRRRKIRCLLDEKDPHGRCQNCIRLKKECNFYPVDQQPTTERRPRAGSKAGEASSTDADVSSTSSPGRPSGNVEQVEKFPQHQFASSRPEAGWNPALGQATASPATIGGSFPPREFQHSLEGNSPWESPTYYSQSPLSLNSGRPRPEDQSPYYVPSSHPFAQSHYGTANPTNPYSQAPLGYGNASAAEDSHWPQPGSQHGMRSMSMVGPEELPSHYQNYHFSAFPNPELKRRPTNVSEVQTVPSLQGSAASSTASTTDSFAPPTLGSYRGPAISSHGGEYADFQSWSSYPDPQQGAVSGSSGYSGSWFGGQHQHRQNPEDMGQYKSDQGHYPDMSRNFSGVG